MPGSPAIARAGSSDSLASTQYTAEFDEDLSLHMLALPPEDELSDSVPRSQEFSVGEERASNPGYYRARNSGSGSDFEDIWDDDGWDTVDIDAENVTPQTTPELGSQRSDSPKRKTPEHDEPETQTRPCKIPKTTSGDDGPPAEAPNKFDARPADSPIVIAYPGLYEALLRKVRWGIVWEIARFCSLPGKSYADLSVDLLKALATPSMTNEVGVDELWNTLATTKSDTSPEQVSTEAAFAREHEAKDPWRELDKEHDFIAGCTAETPLYLHYPGDEGYGGKIHFTMTVQYDPKQRKAQFELERPSLGASASLRRRFGSHSVIEARMSKDTAMRYGPLLRDYFKRPFIISFHVYRAFFSKEHTVFLIRTNEVAVKTQEGEFRVQPSNMPGGVGGAVEFFDFLDEINPIAVNKGQTMSKWSSRIALALSSSVPGPRILPEDLHFINDIVSPAFSGDGKPPAELVMTDGCGYANAEFFEAVRAQFKMPTRITAVQVRLHGAKGLLLRHPEHDVLVKDGRPQVWIRDSQWKIHYSGDRSNNAALYTVDILRLAHMTAAASLSPETIINLAENGVDSQIIVDLMKHDLRGKVDSLTTWDGPNGTLRLWYNNVKEGGVIAGRLARRKVAEARAFGYIFDDAKEHSEEDVDDEDFDKIARGQSTAWWEDTISGCPSSLEETANRLLDAGFMPESCPVLRAKQCQIAKKSIKSPVNNYRLSITMSCSGLAVPDPLGVLEPGEVYIESSSLNLTAADGKTFTSRYTGPALVTRHPCKVATDVQQVLAVDRAELHGLCDVVIVSTKGHRVHGETLPRHLLSMLGGGDYDGDRVQVFWHPAILQGFKSANASIALEPTSVKDCLQKSDESVEDFDRRVSESSITSKVERIPEFQHYLLGSLRHPSLVGKYSTYWEMAIYKFGYSHPYTVELAYLFCAVLDGGKTGVTVKQKRQDQDAEKYRRYCGSGLKWKVPIDSPTTSTHGADSSNMALAKRGPGLKGVFVMDKLRESLLVVREDLIALILKRLPEEETRKCSQPDPDLVAPWADFDQRSKLATERSHPRMSELKDKIKKGVEAKRDEWYEKKGKDGKFTNLPIETRQDILRNLSRSFRQMVANLSQEYEEYSEVDLFRYAASYAYLHDYERLKETKRWSRFPWDVATRALCEIKAAAVSRGDPKTVTSDFYYAAVPHIKFRI